MTASRSDSAEIKICPICRKHVDMNRENHTLLHCRNYLLRLLYREPNPATRMSLDKRINELNTRLGIKSKNLLDT